MDNNGNCLTKQEVVMLVNTLKKLDVRGFESMDMLVGMVAFLNDAMGRTHENKEAPEG